MGGSTYCEAQRARLARTGDIQLDVPVKWTKDGPPRVSPGFRSYLVRTDN